MMAAYWFYNAKAFEEISLALIFHYEDTYLQLAIQGGADAEVVASICYEPAPIPSFKIQAKFRNSFARRSKI